MSEEVRREERDEEQIRPHFIVDAPLPYPSSSSRSEPRVREHEHWAPRN